MRKGVGRWFGRRMMWCLANWIAGRLGRSWACCLLFAGLLGLWREGGMCVSSSRLVGRRTISSGGLW